MASANLFKTVSNRDGLHFWKGNALNFQRVREFMGLETDDLARLAGAANSSVRYDSKAPKEVREHLENIANICNLVFQFLLARCPHCWHYESMAIQINIRDVPEKVRDELAARAALQGKSMQEFLRAELERLAARPSIDAWLQQVRKRKRATQTRISSKQILENRNADRR
jgi:antitoxin FitA